MSGIKPHIPDRLEMLALREEIANSLTHGLGLLLSIAGLSAMLVLASLRGTTWHVVSCGIYGVTLVMLYGASTCYHSFRAPRIKQILRVVDHSCIYLLIAGTYTPFTLTYLRGGWGWTLFGLVWGLALIGLLYKIFFIDRSEAVSLTLYLVMGWLVLIAAKPAIERLPAMCLLLMALGGICYTAGVYFYAKDKQVPYYHTVWHLFVLAGSAFHYFAITLYVIPAAS
jgi:hemolysin III